VSQAAELAAHDAAVIGCARSVPPPMLPPLSPRRPGAGVAAPGADGLTPLPRRAHVSNAHPAQYSTVYVYVPAARRARVRTVAHYKTTERTKFAKTGVPGSATTAYKISRAHRFILVHSLATTDRWRRRDRRLWSGLRALPRASGTADTIGRLAAAPTVVGAHENNPYGRQRRRDLLREIDG
jgi:hypothetical protein